MNEHGLLLAFPPTTPAALGKARGVSGGELTSAYWLSNGAANYANRHRSGGVYRCGVSTRVRPKPAPQPRPSTAPRRSGTVHDDHPVSGHSHRPLTGQIISTREIRTGRKMIAARAAATARAAGEPQGRSPCGDRATGERRRRRSPDAARSGDTWCLRRRPQTSDS